MLSEYHGHPSSGSRRQWSDTFDLPDPIQDTDYAELHATIRPLDGSNPLAEMVCLWLFAINRR